MANQMSPAELEAAMYVLWNRDAALARKIEAHIEAQVAELAVLRTKLVTSGGDPW